MAVLVVSLHGAMRCNPLTAQSTCLHETTGNRRQTDEGIEACTGSCNNPCLLTDDTCADFDTGRRTGLGRGVGLIIDLHRYSRICRVFRHVCICRVIVHWLCRHVLRTSVGCDVLGESLPATELLVAKPTSRKTPNRVQGFVEGDVGLVDVLMGPLCVYFEGSLRGKHVRAKRTCPLKGP